MNDMLDHTNEPHNESELIKCLELPVTKGGKKNNKPKKASIYPKMNMQVKDEKLLAFSYLFAPLLYLGMKGRERQRRQIKNRLIV